MSLPSARSLSVSNGLPTKTVWLMIKRTVGAPPSYRHYISNAPVSTRLPQFVWLSGLRWAIEQCFEEAKPELGMDQYEVVNTPSGIITCSPPCQPISSSGICR
jgi:hypothetical protein